ncbi:NmrA/HSCARG family protein [Anaeromyxobacter oryzae]|uniref:Nucleotide-diphosphate-sugar epimerase n=1 Tax=Anaeromyxobacter oryzae TaxID=2918170 RepID=A0ABM7WUH9_9BACT|nr:NmrA/HSCARG family protein [Anaeromyxobacter oryzae]BDG03120.1 nucleotide-diphosphate-sugar epimerase [Anaeromyxobacter oryzae]
MAEKKTIAVIGATGAQGGGLVRAILADREGPFAVRAITRDTGSEKARALSAAGAQVVAGDADDPPSLRSAFAGAHGAFCVTNFWEHFSPERELAQARAMARAAKDAGVSHVVWSTLEDTRDRVPLEDSRLGTLKGKYKVPHFDAKGEADRTFANESAPTTFLRAAFYWENFIHFGMGPRPGSDGDLVLALPLGGGKLPGIAADDIGRCAYGVFRRGGQLVGRYVGIAGEVLTGPEMAAAFSRALGRKVAFHDMPFDQYRALGFPGADDLGNMFEYQALCNDEFCASRDVALSRSLDPELQSFAAWLERNKARIPLG